MTLRPVGSYVTAKEFALKFPKLFYVIRTSVFLKVWFGLVRFYLTAY